MTITHTKVSAIGDGDDATQVRPSDWNASHTVIPDTATITSSSTPTPDCDTTSHYTVTALEEAAEFGEPSGSPLDGQKLTIRIKDNATARDLTWNIIYRAGTDLVLPTTTVLSKTLYCGFIYNSADSKWDLVAYIDNI